MPARSNKAEKQTTEINGSPAFKFQVPYSMRCPADPKVYLAEDEAIDRTTAEDGEARWLLDARAEKIMSNNKKRKSVRAQTYLKREAEATIDDMSRADEVHDADYGSDESRLREISGGEDREGSEIYDDVEVPKRFWYRRKEDRLPFSHEEKARRLRAVKARCRIRRMIKAREGKGTKKELSSDSKGKGDQDEDGMKVNEAEKPSTSGVKKPSRVERRAAALRRETGGAKARPTLAELRARIGKGYAKEEAAVDLKGGRTEESQAIAPPSKSIPPASHKTTASVKGIKKTPPPTCVFTFTSRSMAANRLVSMRAELDVLHKNLQEARKDFEDLRRLEKETAASRVVSGLDGNVSSAAATIANESHDRMLESVKALTASCKAVTSVAAVTQKELNAPDRGLNSKGKANEVSSSFSPLAAKTTAVSSTDRVPPAGTLASTTTTALTAISDKVALSKPAPPSAPPSVPPPLPPTSAIPPTPSQQKTPPPLSRRRKANMSNIHHISNHRPSRQLTAEGGIGSGARSVSSQSQQNQSGQIETTVPGMDHPTTTTCLFANEWMCVFCEYRLLYGEYPRMMGAVKSRKKLVAKKKDAQERAHRATTIGAPASSKSRMQCTCGRAHARAMQAVAKELGEDEHDHHSHDHDHDHHSHDHDNDHHHHHHHHYHDEEERTPLKPLQVKQQ